ncbi:hypothetical protein D3C73_1616390 [compost metagenome]
MEERGTVVNVQQHAEGLELRIVCEEAPCGNARQVEPCLEDVYMHYFRAAGVRA